MADAPRIEAPNPESVSTLADLARELGTLKLWHGDPSLRDLTKACGVAPSTLHDALTGQRQPKLDTVLRMVRALAVDEQPWREAWIRAKYHRRHGGGAHPVESPATTVQSRPGTPEPRVPATAADLPPLASMNVKQAARRITELPRGAAITELHGMASPAAAERLTLVPTAQVADLLAGMDEDAAGKIAASLGATVAAAALDAMATDAAVGIVEKTPYAAVPRILTALPPARAAEILLDSRRWMDKLRGTGGMYVGAGTVVSILAEMDDQFVVEFLTQHAGVAVPWLEAAPPELAARWLTAVNAQQAGAWLEHGKPETLTAVAPFLSTARVRAILQAMSDHGRVKSLTHLNEDVIVKVLTALPANERQRWLQNLQGRLPRDTYRRLFSLGNQ